MSIRIYKKASSYRHFYTFLPIHQVDSRVLFFGGGTRCKTHSFQTVSTVQCFCHDGNKINKNYNSIGVSAININQLWKKKRKETSKAEEGEKSKGCFIVRHAEADKCCATRCFSTRVVQNRNNPANRKNDLKENKKALSFVNFPLFLAEQRSSFSSSSESPSSSTTQSSPALPSLVPPTLHTLDTPNQNVCNNIYAKDTESTEEENVEFLKNDKNKELRLGQKYEEQLIQEAESEKPHLHENKDNLREEKKNKKENETCVKEDGERSRSFAIRHHSYLNKAKYVENIKKIKTTRELLDFFVSHREEFKTEELMEIVKQIHSILKETFHRTIKKKAEKTRKNMLKKRKETGIEESNTTFIEEKTKFNEGAQEEKKVKDHVLFTQEEKVAKIEENTESIKEDKNRDYESKWIDDEFYDDNNERKWQDICKDHTRRPEFLKIITDITRNVHRYTCNELLLILQNLSDIHFMDRSFYKLAETFILKNIFCFSPDEISTLGCIYTKANVSSKLMLHELVILANENAKRMSNRSLASISAAFSKASFKPVQFMTAVLPAVRMRIDKFDARELGLVMYAFAKQPNACDEVFIEDAATTFSKKHMQHASIPSVLRAVWAVASIIPNNPTLLLDAEETLSEHIDELNARAVASLVWAYSRCFVGSNEFFCKLKNRALQVYTKMTPQGLSNLLYGFSITLGRTLNEVGEIDGEFNLTVENHIIKIIDNFDILDLAATCASYGMTGYGTPELFEVLKDKCIRNAADFSAECIAKVLFSFASARLCMSIMGGFQLHVLERIHQFSLHGLCDVCWSYAVAKTYDKQFWEAMLSLIPPSVVSKDERCCLLFPALLDVSLAIPALQSNMVEKLKANSRDSFWKLQQSEFPALFAADVKNALEQLQKSWELENEPCVHTSHDFDGLLVDVFFEDKKTKKKYGCICHTSLTIHKPTDKPRGSAVLKHRNLKRLGVEVINIRWDVWTKLENEEEKVKLIGEKIHLK